MRKGPGMPDNWDWNERDEAAARQLQRRLPEEIFDAHAHLYRVEDLGGDINRLIAAGPRLADVEAWRGSLARQVGPSRVVGGLLSPMPCAECDLDAANRFILAQVQDRPESRALLLVAPAMKAADVEPLLAGGGVTGFKPYHLFSTQRPTFQAPIATFLPEWAWRLADEHGLVITLHMVRDRALADPANQAEIIAACRKYPNAKLVLAHAARGFHAPNTRRGISSLRGLENVWFDTSGICEAAAIRAIINEFGPRRVMWGSDFPICERRGKYVTVGDGFCWINPDRADVHEDSPEVNALPVGLESLQAVLDAAEECFCNEDDLRDIFADNARRMLGLAEESGTLTQDLYHRAKKVIPAGTQLVSKRPEMFAPEQWPGYYREARGCEVWDLDGGHYYDVSISGVGTCLLGFRDPDVTRSVQRAINSGSMSSLNAPEEVELAEMLCEIHPWAEQVRFARTGGELASVAVRIARATTDRSHVAVCGYHGWADWYLAANLGREDSLRGHLLPGLKPLGVPRELRGTVSTFTYNDRQEFSRAIAEHGRNLAAVIMEPCRHADPEPGFLEFVRDETHKAGALLIFDEITIGWRRTYGGSHLLLGVQPDMALFAKTISNGHPMAAVIGTREAMSGAQESFISSTYWTERVGPAAALATLKKMKKVDVVSHVNRIGSQLQQVLRNAAADTSLPVKVSGYTCVPRFEFEHELAQELKTLYVQLMLERGFLASTMIYVTLAHTEQIVAMFADALNEVFGEIAEAIKRGDVQKRLNGPVAHRGFRRLL